MAIAKDNILKYSFRVIISCAILFFLILAVRTYVSLNHNIITDFANIVGYSSGAQHDNNIQFLSREGHPLNISYQHQYNYHQQVSFYDVPEFLVQALIIAEDKRFYEHGGVDWLARASAMYSNLTNMKVVRGGSTITEQVVRIIKPRRRSLWSRWLEGFDAMRLEQYYSKADILEFYLNQVPYASNRRGISQAASFYFDRDLYTLSKKEMLALVVLIRAPSYYDLYKRGYGANIDDMGEQPIENTIMRLAGKMHKNGMLDEYELDFISKQGFELARPQLSVYAPEFVVYIKEIFENNRQLQGQLQDGLSGSGNKIVTTLDAELQNNISAMMEQRVVSLASRRLYNGAVLVANWRTGEIMAWVVAGKGGDNHDNTKKTSRIDAVTTMRQPGSALKPFLYGLALQQGWQAYDVVVDESLATSVGWEENAGWHNFRNYSNQHYGQVTIRQALANSLNIPAVSMLREVGHADYLRLLQNVGFDGLQQGSDFYGDGLALGSGEVSLLQLVRAYMVLANNGVSKELSPFVLDGWGQGNAEISERVFSSQVTSVISDILSDKYARIMEFGEASILSLPRQTAVKTGTSSDYRDSWAVGYDSNYVVGVWLGNLDRSEMDGITGSIGPALLLRGVFAELARMNKDSKRLYLHPDLQLVDICHGSEDNCKLQEYHISKDGFVNQRLDNNYALTNVDDGQDSDMEISLVKPVPGLNLAYDPRIRKENQAVEFQVSGIEPGMKVRWLLNDKLLAETADGSYLWSIDRGRFELAVEIFKEDNMLLRLPEVAFVVK